MLDSGCGNVVLGKEDHRMTCSNRLWHVVASATTIVFFLFSQGALEAWAHEAGTPSITVCSEDGGTCIEFPLDGRDWTIGSQHKSASSEMVELVVDGQSVNKWQELVTIEFFPGLQLKTTARGMAEAFLARLKETAPNFVGKVISQSDDDVTLEWKIANNPGVVVDPMRTNQCELDRILTSRNGIHFLHYAIKTADISTQKRTTWLRNLGSASLKY